jgi:hypothetical protein
VSTSGNREIALAAFKSLRQIQYISGLRGLEVISSI